MDFGLVPRNLWSSCFIHDGLKWKGSDNILHTPEFRELRQRDVPRKSKRAQRPDAVPVWIDFIPGDAMPGSLRNRMVIVMPAFAESKNGNPETVRRVIAGHETLRTPHVRGGIHEPGGVQAEHSPHEDAPHQIRQSAKDE